MLYQNPNRSKKKPPKIDLTFALHDRQLEAFNSPAQELLYGGSAGGGKSHLERIVSLIWCLEIPGLQYYLFRRQYSDLIKSYIEGPTGYLQLLQPLIKANMAQVVAKEIRFSNGSKIFLCHCQYEKDVLNFGSFEFHVLNIAEAGEFTPFMIKYLRSRVRIPNEFKTTIPSKYLLPRNLWRTDETEWQFPRILMTANPIGPGKQYLKQNFVDKQTPGELWRASDEDGGMLRQFIPAFLKDNPSIDPISYAAQLRGIGNQGYVDALLEGKWDSPIGAFFPQLDRERHLIKPFVIPKHWPKFMAYDHGACGNGDPFSCGWATVSDGSIPVFSSVTGEAIPCQKNSIVWYRRWNGQGLPKQDAKRIADGILARESEEILFRIAGGDIMERRGHGESIFSIFSANGIDFRRADMRRLNGWAQVDYRLTGERGYPLMFWTEECEGDLESMSTLQHDINNPQDCAGGDDHDADRVRYGSMTRPVAKEETKKEDIDYRGFNETATIEDLITQATRGRNKERGLYG